MKNLLILIIILPLLGCDVFFSKKNKNPNVDIVDSNPTENEEYDTTIIYEDPTDEDPEPHPEFGSVWGLDAEGNVTAESTEYWNLKLEESMDELKNRGLGLFDVVMQEDVEPNMDAIKEALDAHLGHGLNEVPSEREIYNQIRKMLGKWSSHPVNDDLFFTKTMMTRKGRFLEFKKLRNTIPVNIDRMYEDFAKELMKDQYIGNTNFPDESDSILNFVEGESNEARQGKIYERKSYLLNFLQGIKNRPIQTFVVNNPAQVIFPTSGNTKEWFGETQYKLYHLWKQLPTLTDVDKKTLLSMFLHAGRHCSDAKKDQINAAFGLFAADQMRILRQQESDLASTLYDKLVSLNTKLKQKMMNRTIDDAFQEATTSGTWRIQNYASLLSNGVSNVAEYVMSESSTYKATTLWAYGHKIGLKNDPVNYPTYQVTLNDQDFLKHYTINKLEREVEREFGDHLKEKYLGDLKHIIRSSDESDFLRHILFNYGFISDSQPISYF